MPVADAPVAVDGVADRHGVDQFLVGAALKLARLGQRPAHIGVVDLVAADRDFHVGGLRGRLAAGDIDQHLADRLPAICSAVWTVVPIACSAASISTIVPARAP